MNQKVDGSIPGLGTCLGCRPGPQLGACGRHLIDVSLIYQCFFLFLSSPAPKIINKIIFLKKENVWSKVKKTTLHCQAWQELQLGPQNALGLLPPPENIRIKGQHAQLSLQKSSGAEAHHQDAVFTPHFWEMPLILGSWPVCVFALLRMEVKIENSFLKKSTWRLIHIFFL